VQPPPPTPCFSDAGLQPGDVITFCFDQTVTATVKNDYKIYFEGKTSTINAVALMLLRRDGFTPRSVDGWSYWSFNGDLLSSALVHWWVDNSKALPPKEQMAIQTVEHYIQVLTRLRPVEKQRFEHIDRLWPRLLSVNFDGSEVFDQALDRLFDQTSHMRLLGTSLSKR
jgi:hypothetical protein